MKAKTEQKENKSGAGFVTKYVLVKPHISEKATDLAATGFYVFKVEKTANKKEIKVEVEKKYKVRVTSVRVINIPSKRKRVGKTLGKKKGYKKAIVGVKKGQSIDLMLT